MKINRNMSAVLTNKQLRRTENKLQASMERLSSGFKINSAGQNPAGMAISNRMRAQIDALKQAGNNSKDGVSVIQIADGALTEVTNMLQRMRELAVQAANDTNSYTDRQSIQKEIEQLRTEVDRVSRDTEYNTKSLLDGSSDVRVYSEGISRVNISEQVTAGHYNLSNITVGTQASDEISIPATFPDGGKIAINGVSMDVNSTMTQDDVIKGLQDLAAQVGAEVEINGSSMTLNTKDYGLDVELNFSVSPELSGMLSGATEEVDGMIVKTNHGTDASVTLDTVGYGEVGFTQNATWTSKGNRVFIQDNNGFRMEFMIKDGKTMKAGEIVDKTGLKDGDSIDLEVTEIGKMILQIGANEYQTMDVRIPSVSADSMYLDTVDVAIEGGASRAITTLDDAIAYLSSVRSRLGACQNRLEYTSASLDEANEDMTAAYSRLLDTDMAQEMSEYAQLNVLDQATISVLSQANDLPKQILSLLG